MAVVLTLEWLFGITFLVIGSRRSWSDRLAQGWLSRAERIRHAIGISHWQLERRRRASRCSRWQFLAIGVFGVAGAAFSTFVFVR